MHGCLIEGEFTEYHENNILKTQKFYKGNVCEGKCLMKYENEVRKQEIENPTPVEDLIEATKEAFEAESEIVEWIFEKGDLDFLTKAQTIEFIKHRFNISLNSIDIENVFEVNEKLLETTEWFDDEILTTKHTDFFNKRSINYSKKSKSITLNDLF